MAPKNKKLTKSAVISRFTNLKYKSAFGGINRVLKQLKSDGYNVNREAVVKHLETQPSFVRQKKVVQKFTRLKTTARFIDEQWHIDILYMVEYGPENQGYKYLLNIVDAFSRFLFSKPLKTKTAKEAKEAFSSIIKTTNRKPIFLFSDYGNEFRSVFSNFCKNHVIQQIFAFGQPKAYLVENANKTLKLRILKYMQYTYQYTYIDNYNYLYVILIILYMQSLVLPLLR
jgi:hypothetical protein